MHGQIRLSLCRGNGALVACHITMKPSEDETAGL